jgi:phage gpG-like protein
MILYLQIKAGEFERILAARGPNQQKMEAIGFYIRQQILDRFSSQGASGGTPWPIKKIKEWGHDDGRAILTGRSSLLLESFQSYATGDTAVVFSDRPYAAVHQLGTIGKGGLLPDIVPKRAKALFIPITDRAADSSLIGGRRVSNQRLPRLPGVAPQLIKGRLKGGRLEGWNFETGRYDPAVKPDFIFLQKVSIPPRQMLPTSEQEIAAQQEFAIDMLTSITH